MNKTEIKNIMNSDENYLMAALEIDIIDWNAEENTPEFFECDTSEKKRSNIKFIPPKSCEKFVPKLPGFNSPCNVFPKSEINTVEIDKSQEDVWDMENCFLSLADEIILKIFSYLPHSSISKSVMVCRRWKKLGYDKVLWKKVNLQEQHIEHPYLNRILHRRVNILSINQAEIFSAVDIDNCCLIEEECCENFALTHVDATMSKFEKDILSSLLGKCRCLQKLSLEGCKIGLSECIAISCNEKIQILNLSMVSGLSPVGLDTITKKCGMIKSLNLSWTGLTKDSVKFISRCKNMEELNLSGLVGGMTKKVIEKLLTSCTLLVSIDLSDVKLQIGILRLISHCCCNLQKLSISRCTEVSTDRLLEFSKLQTLSHINLFGFVNSNTLDLLSRARPDIYLNKETFSTIARPISTATYKGKIWEHHVGFTV